MNRLRDVSRESSFTASTVEKESECINFSMHSNLRQVQNLSFLTPHFNAYFVAIEKPSDNI
jgi:hypothetical protein